MKNNVPTPVLLAISICGTAFLALSINHHYFGDTNYSEFRNLGLSIAGLIGLPILIWRAFLNKEQIDQLIDQNKRESIRLENEIEYRKRDEYFQRYNKAIANLSDSEQSDNFLKISAIKTLTQLAIERKDDREILKDVISLLNAYIRENLPKISGNCFFYSLTSSIQHLENLKNLDNTYDQIKSSEALVYKWLEQKDILAIQPRRDVQEALNSIAELSLFAFWDPYIEGEFELIKIPFEGIDFDLEILKDGISRNLDPIKQIGTSYLREVRNNHRHLRVDLSSLVLNGYTLKGDFFNLDLSGSLVVNSTFSDFYCIGLSINSSSLPISSFYKTTFSKCHIFELRAKNSSFVDCEFLEESKLEGSFEICQFLNTKFRSFNSNHIHCYKCTKIERS